MDAPSSACRMAHPWGKGPAAASLHIVFALTFPQEIYFEYVQVSECHEPTGALHNHRAPSR
ncbi:hypothetical protein SCLCIDRAFT_252127 [Scleroderma citrinum Foug A]|uniref:Uncharacterized protein n=1 Tax=Scleroderma citrinum Foug A TaxID=1036808 RepID=A0A0C3EFP3_9AGAM|nr:hypothetical protein SCLCIDRAFT_252127 [Scleroderma citrinum Foug A]